MNVRQAPTEATVAHEPTTRELRRVPLVIVHTGDGKGKSTAAFGLLLRAWGQGWPIGVFQFVKSSRWRTGEQAAFAELHRVTKPPTSEPRSRGTHSGTGGRSTAARAARRSPPTWPAPPGTS